jgi:hypothetical protein
MATYCSAPINISISQTIAIPGQGILLSWSGASSGIDNQIIGYLIQFKDNQADLWNTYCTIYASMTSFFTTVEASASRGNSRYWRIITLGSNDDLVTDTTKPTSETVSCKTNRKPLSPLVSSNKSVVPYNGLSEDKTVIFTITPNLQNDDESENQTFYYSLSESGEKVEIPSPGSVLVNNTNTYYFWSYDGLEYCDLYTGITITKNSLPIFSSLSFINDFNNIGPNNSNLTTGTTLSVSANSDLIHSLSIKYKIQYSEDTTFQNIYEDSGFIYNGENYTYDLNYLYNTLPDSTKINITKNFGKYYKITARIIDNTFPTDYIDVILSPIFLQPNKPIISTDLLILQPINEKTGDLMDASYYRYFYRHWFNFGVEAFPSASNLDGYGKIISGSVYYNNDIQTASSLNIQNGALLEDKNVEIKLYNEQTAPSTINVQIILTDEFGISQSYSIQPTKNLTKITDSLNINNYVSTTYNSIDNKNGIAVFDIDDFELSFVDLKTTYPNSFNYLNFDLTQKTNYQKITFLNSQLFDFNDFSILSDSDISLTLKTKTSFSSPSTTTGLINNTTKLLNQENNNANFIIYVYDAFGIVHSLSLSSNVNLDFRATPKLSNNAPNGALTITSKNWINPYNTSLNTYLLYKNQEISIKFNQVIFSDNNLSLGANESLKAKIYFYNQDTLINSTSTLLDCSNTTSSINLTLTSSLIGSFSNQSLITVKISAIDITSLESPLYTLGNFIIFEKTIPSLLSLTQLVYDIDSNLDIIKASYSMSYAKLSYTPPSGQEVSSVKNMTLSLANYAPLLGTLTTINLMESEYIPKQSVSEINQTVFTLTDGTDRQTINSSLKITVTYHDNTTLTFSSNNILLRSADPLISARANSISINKFYEDIPSAFISNNILYIHTNSNVLSKIYLVNDYGGESRVITIDTFTKEIDGAVISGGSYE